MTVGDHTNVAAGDGATVVQLAVEDVTGLIAAAAEYLDPAGVSALLTSLEIDGGAPAERRDRSWAA